MIATANLTTLDEMKRAALERRKRIFGNPRVEKASRTSEMEIECARLKQELHNARTMIDDLQGSMASEVRELKHQISEYQRAAMEYMRQMDELRSQVDAKSAICTRKPVNQIIAEVAAEFDGITVDDIMSAKRAKALIEARFAAIYAVYKRRPDLSYPRIGKFFGDRDHTSIMHAVREVENGRWQHLRQREE